MLRSADTFVKLPDFTKGMIFINGKPLSRYWSKGPQLSAYLPAPFLNKGINEVIVFETDSAESITVEFVDVPELG